MRRHLGALLASVVCILAASSAIAQTSIRLTQAQVQQLVEITAGDIGQARVTAVQANMLANVSAAFLEILKTDYVSAVSRMVARQDGEVAGRLRTFVRDAERAQRPYRQNMAANVALVRTNLKIVRKLMRELAGFPGLSGAQRPPAGASSLPQVTTVANAVVIDTREEVLTQLMLAVGQVSQSDRMSTTVSIPILGVCVKRVWGVPIPYPCITTVDCDASISYTVGAGVNQVQVIPAGLLLTGQGHASVSATFCGLGPSLSYDPAVNGQLGIGWDSTRQEASISVDSLYVEIYVQIPNPFDGDWRVTFGYIDIAPCLPRPLCVRQIPIPAQTVTLQLPGGAKTITFTPTNAVLGLGTGYFRVSADLRVTGQ
jgi:hypothetical protein